VSFHLESDEGFWGVKQAEGFRGEGGVGNTNAYSTFWRGNGIHPLNE